MDHWSISRRVLCKLPRELLPPSICKSLSFPRSYRSPLYRPLVIVLCFSSPSHGFLHPSRKAFCLHCLWRSGHLGTSILVNAFYPAGILNQCRLTLEKRPNLPHELNNDVLWGRLSSGEFHTKAICYSGGCKLSSRRTKGRGNTVFLSGRIPGCYLPVARCLSIYCLNGQETTGLGIDISDQIKWPLFFCIPGTQGDPPDV